MKFALKISAALGAMAFLAGCASSYDVDSVAGMNVQGGEFANALHKHYVERARFEVGEGDWSSVQFFNERAKMTAMGDVAPLQMPSDRMLKVDQGAINNAYTSLFAALKTTAPQQAPDACARAQTWLEHWMEQSEEGHQADHIAMARKGFEDAMPNCKGKFEPMAAKAPPAPMALPDPVIIYFPFDSFEISSANEALIDKAAASAKKSKATSVVLIGHTDRSGSNNYNMALSRARVSAVANGLMEAGVDRSMIQKNFAGETSPQVQTDDGVRERMNRRVEIVFGR